MAESAITDAATVELIKDEIRERMWVCPSFFLLAADSLELMEHLWRELQLA